MSGSSSGPGSFYGPDIKPKGIPIQKVAKILEEADMNGGTNYVCSDAVVWKNKYEQVRQGNESLRKQLANYKQRMVDMIDEAYKNGYRDGLTEKGEVKNDPLG